MYLYYKELAGRYQANSISKDKVKEKIEELENKQDDINILQAQRDSMEYQFKQAKSELEKKDKIINEMATTLSSVCTGIEVIRKQFEENYCEFMNSDEDCCWKADKECSDCIKEYFTNKVEREGK